MTRNYKIRGLRSDYYLVLNDVRCNAVSTRAHGCQTDVLFPEYRKFFDAHPDLDGDLTKVTVRLVPKADVVEYANWPLSCINSHKGMLTARRSTSPSPRTSRYCATLPSLTILPRSMSISRRSCGWRRELDPPISSEIEFASARIPDISAGPSCAYRVCCQSAQVCDDG